MNAAIENWQIICNSESFHGKLGASLDNNTSGLVKSVAVFRYESASEVFAVKRYKFEQALQQYTQTPDCFEDIKFCSSIKHRNIVKLFCVKRKLKEVFLFFELMEGKTLKAYIQSLNDVKKFMQQEKALMFTAHILNGLDYLHAFFVAHRDIKPENLLLNGDRSVLKIADFNLSKQLSEKSQQSIVVKGTWNYMAPEVARCEKYNVKSDIWSVGATLVEMLCGLPPFSDCKTNVDFSNAFSQVGVSKAKPDYDLTVRSDLKKDCTDLLDMIFQPRLLRPSAAALLACECFKAFDLHAAENDYSKIPEYDLDKKDKGIVFIINLEKYPPPNERLGSQVDVKRLEKVFKAINFEPQIVENLNAVEVTASIRKFLSDEPARKTSSIVIVILAHGTKDCVFGVDCKPVSLRSILDLLFENNDKCSFVQPKLLLIQACRGPNQEKFNETNVKQKAAGRGVKSDNTNNAVMDNYSNLLGAFDVDYELNNKTNSNILGNTESTSSFNKFCDKDYTQLECAPAKSDIVVAYSTFETFAAYRNAKDGSFYIKCCCEVVEQFWKTFHVLDILTEVNRRTSLAVIRASEGNYTQVPQLVASLRKQFYFSDKSERGKQIATSKKSTEAQIKKHLLILAGGTINSDSYAYDAMSDTWRKVASLSCPRRGAAAAFWNGKMVVAGGYNRENKSLHTIEQFDPETNTWTLLPHMLHSRQWLALVCFENTLFAIGGSDGTSLESVERFSLNWKTWEKVAPLNVQRSNLCCAVLSVGIIAAGGSDGSSTLQSCELYESTTQKWKFVDSLVIARSSASAAALDNKVYVFGGYTGWMELIDSEELDSVEEFDFVSNKWTLLLEVKLREKRSGLSAATVNGLIYVCGGKNSLLSSLSTFESFDASKKEIRSLSKPLPQAVWGAALGSVPVSDRVLTKLFSAG